MHGKKNVVKETLTSQVLPTNLKNMFNEAVLLTKPQSTPETSSDYIIQTNSKTVRII